MQTGGEGREGRGMDVRGTQQIEKIKIATEHRPSSCLSVS